MCGSQYACDRESTHRVTGGCVHEHVNTTTMCPEHARMAMEHERWNCKLCELIDSPLAHFDCVVVFLIQELEGARIAV